MGTAVLLVEQNVSRALTLVQRAYVLESGRVIMHGQQRRAGQQQAGAGRLPRAVAAALHRAAAGLSLPPCAGGPSVQLNNWIGSGMLMLLASAGVAAAQAPSPGYVPAPVPTMPAAPVHATAMPAPKPQQPLAPGSMAVRLDGRLVSGFGVVSDSGRK